MRSRVRDASTGGGVPRRRRMLILVALSLVAVAALVGWHATISHSTPQQAATGLAGTGSATVVRTDVVAQQQVPGTLGYLTTPPVLNQLPGVLTAVPSPGTMIRRGEQLYAVNGQ